MRLRDPRRPTLADLDAVCQVTTARSVAEVEALRPQWSRIESSDIDTDIDYFLTVVTQSPQVLRPHVILVERVHRDPMLIVGRIERMQMKIRLGYKLLASPEITALVGAFEGLIGADDDSDGEVVLTQLQRALDTREADLVLWPKVDVGGLMHSLVWGRVGMMRRWCSPPVGRWVAPITENPEDFLAHKSSKARQQLRYYDRKLRREYGTALSVRHFERAEDFEVLCRDIEAVAVKTYQYQLGANPVAPGLPQALIHRGLDRGWFKAWVLYVAEKPIAFWLGTSYGTTFATGTPGFDPEYAKQRVGTFTMLRMVEDLSNSHRIRSIDFGHGDAEYKQFFASQTRVQQDVLIFAARPRALAIRVFMATAATLTLWVKRVIDTTSWGPRLRKVARNRLLERGHASRGDGVQ